jgi:putative endonuclease
VTRWNVYIVRCSDGTLYTGIATDVDRRVEEHNFSPRLGANYTRARRPVVLVYQETAATRSDALKREYRIRRLGRVEKELLISTWRDSR